MSQATCTRLLIATAALSLVIVLVWHGFVARASFDPGAIVEIIGKSLLLWPGLALIVGIVAELVVELRG